MKSNLIVLALLMTTVVCKGSDASDATQNKLPNIVFFLVDDLGWSDVGCFGSSFYDTPHVDGLARSGMRFTNAYAACPVCSPTRASILTGRYPSRTGITDYINAAGGNQPRRWRRNTRLLPAAYSDRMAHSEVTLAEALKGAGYATFFAGKWHLGPEGFWPESQGFDVNQGGITRGGPYGGKKYFSPYGNPRLKDGPAGEHLPARLARETVKEVPHPDIGTLRAIDWPYKFSETPTRIRSVPPELGAHTEEVLTEILGFGESELAELKEQKLFG